MVSQKRDRQVAGKKTIRPENFISVLITSLRQGNLLPGLEIFDKINDLRIGQSRQEAFRHHRHFGNGATFNVTLEDRQFLADGIEHDTLAVFGRKRSDQDLTVLCGNRDLLIGVWNVGTRIDHIEENVIDVTSI